MKLITYPNRGLITPCKPVEDFGRSLHKDIQQIHYAMDHFNQKSLTFNQISGQTAIFSMFLSTKVKKVLVNPHILEESIYRSVPEICGSFPGCVFQDILRPSKITIEFIEFGQMKSTQAVFRGEQARIIAHEMDHINGVITDGYIDQWKNRFTK